MPRTRLRTKFLLSVLVVSVGLTCASLLVVRHVIQKETRREIFSDLTNSALAFQRAHQQRELALTHSAVLLADLPTLKALMTTRDEATIQDASAEFWRLAGGDLFVLADPSGKVVALHTTSAPGLSREAAQRSLLRSLVGGDSIQWWLAGGHLCEVSIQPVYFGPPDENRLLGFLATGYQIDSHVAAEMRGPANGQVAFAYDKAIVVSTLPPAQTTDLVRILTAESQVANQPSSVRLRGEEFLLTSVPLSGSFSSPVHLTVLKSYDQATTFLRHLNRLLAALGLLAMFGGGAVGSFIAHTSTRPLKELVLGVRSLEKGNFDFPLARSGNDEVGELTGAFKRMRGTLQQTQHQLLEAERFATIGQMATSISHDLRHSLTAVEANAEFLSESALTQSEREQLYQEVRIGVDQMTDLIDSMVEFSKSRESLRLAYVNLEESIQRAIGAIRANPDFRDVPIECKCDDPADGWFDNKKLERVFYNLLRNACEALPERSGRVSITVARDSETLVARVADNGHGIPDAIRESVFQPFVSYGKENGTGLGLAVVYKIVRDHGGDAAVEKTSSAGTVFKVVLPRNSRQAVANPEDQAASATAARNQGSS